VASFERLLKSVSVPAADAVEALAVLIRAGRVEEFLPFIRGDVDSARATLLGIQDYYHREPVEAVNAWNKMASDLRFEYRSTARRKLDTLRKLHIIGTVEREQSEKMNLIADTSNQLLELSLSEDLLSRIEGAVRRGSQLMEWSVSQASSETADGYLSEAATCFLYGLFTSSAVMCRSLLEEITERRLPLHLLAEGRLADPKRRTLGDLLDVLNNNFPEVGVSAETPRLIRRVNELGSRAAHQEAIEETDALECLQKTRLAIIQLLS
jgi:hypothetical protein